tara:strand:+ start:908 stop:1411 length:504 start_codon:yes stop_codon:yes gene_type:complete
MKNNNINLYYMNLPCSTSVGISIVFIVAMFFSCYRVDKGPLMSEFYNSLSKTQQMIYSHIINQRRKIYLKGYAYGFLISILIIGVNYLLRNQIFDRISLISFTCATTFLTVYFYYILHKKEDYIVRHLKTQKQLNSWLKIYRKMQFNYHLGLVLGIIAVGVLSFSFC